MKNMDKNLEKLQNFVNEMKNTSSLNEKKVIIDSIKNNRFITKALNYALDPYKKYYVTSKTCKKNSDICDMNLIHDDIFSLLLILGCDSSCGARLVRFVDEFSTAL